MTANLRKRWRRLVCAVKGHRPHIGMFRKVDQIKRGPYILSVANYTERPCYRCQRCKRWIRFQREADMMYDQGWNVVKYATPGE